MRNIKLFAIASMAALIASPAFAGNFIPSPAPVMGAGIGALALMGIGYLAIRRRGR